MKNITLNSNGKILSGKSISNIKSCTCYLCEVCTACAIFPPIVAAFLAPTLAGNIHVVNG